MYRQFFEQWLADPLIGEEYKQELNAIRDEKEIEDRFYADLEFGTAGMRGVLGAGRNRMNAVNVAKATQGLADYLKKLGAASVAIAYDSRNKSFEFARETACVLCANGVRSYLFRTLHSVPQLSFTIRLLHCDAGVAITASHNPKQYNGYKVFGSDGGQMNPEQAREITKHIRAVESLSDVRSMDLLRAEEEGVLKWIGDAEDKAYYSAVEGLSLQPGLAARRPEFSLVYTPLHGSGNVPVRRVLSDIGLANVFVVEAQEEPDGEFPTVSAPNPEAADAFDLAKDLAERKGAGLLLATDPDADRLGVAVRDQSGGFVSLTGNQIGCLLLHYILSKRKELGRLPQNGLAVKSIVSTTMANAIAADYGVEIAEVLTGFRYIAGKIAACETSGKQFLFGFEESFGFNAGEFVRDKDAISSAMLLSEAALDYDCRGMTLLDGLRELFEKYGYYGEEVKSFTLYGKDGMERINGAMTFLRARPPESIAGCKVCFVRDYSTRRRTNLETGECLPIDLPSSDVLYYELENGAWLCARPSGTEPKLKLYANGASQSERQTSELLSALLCDFEKLLSDYIG